MRVVAQNSGECSSGIKFDAGQKVRARFIYNIRNTFNYTYLFINCSVFFADVYGMLSSGVMRIRNSEIERQYGTCPRKFMKISRFLTGNMQGGWLLRKGLD